MTELSPAAQAVLNAVEDHAEFRYRRLAAAALRAAAAEIEDLYCSDDVEDSPGVVFALCKLLTIADELDSL